MADAVDGVARVLKGGGHALRALGLVPLPLLLLVPLPLLLFGMLLGLHFTLPTGSRIDRASRTIQVRAMVQNPQDRLRPGMSFRVEMRLPGETWPAVDPLAIQWSSAGAHVWRAVDGKVERVAVSIIQRNSDSVLVDGPLQEGDLVVTEGLQSLRPGAAIRIQGEKFREGGQRPQVSDAS